MQQLEPSDELKCRVVYWLTMDDILEDIVPLLHTIYSASCAVCLVLSYSSLTSVYIHYPKTHFFLPTQASRTQLYTLSNTNTALPKSSFVYADIFFNSV